MAFTLSGATLVQTGTDADCTGLRAITGVLATNATNINQNYIIPDAITLISIAGDFQLDPAIECVFTGTVTRMEVQNGGIFRYGKLLTTSGKPQYSRGIGLVMNRSSGTQNTTGANIFLRNGSQLIGRGGTIKTATSITASDNQVITVGTAIIDIEQTELFNMSHLGIQILRLFLPAANVKLQNVVLSGRINQGIPFSSLGFNEFSGEIDFASIQVDGNGAKPDQLYGNIAFANNKATRDYSYIAAGNNMNNMNRTIFQNPDIGSLIRTLGLNANTRRIGLVEIRKDVAGTVASEGVAVENAVRYMKLNGASVTPPAGTRFAADDYLTPRVYTTVSSAAGELASTDVLYATAQSYNTGPAGSPLTMDSLTSRPNDVQSNFVWSYDHLLSAFDIAMRGVGEIAPEATLFADPSVTLSRDDALAKLASSFTVDLVGKRVIVTADSSYDDVYDALKAFKCSTVTAQIEAPVIGQTIVTANGELVTAFADYELVVNAGVTLSEGDKFKRIRFDTVTVNGSITGVFSSSAGTSKIVEIVASTGSTVYVGDNSTGVTKLFLTNVAAGTYRAFYEPGAAPTVLVARELYPFQRFAEVVTLTDGLNRFVPVDVEDVGIAEADLATVQAYTELGTDDQRHDRVAAYRLGEEGIKLGQIVTRSGNSLEWQSPFSVKIKKDAALVLSKMGNVFTFKTNNATVGTRYNNNILPPPATFTADTDELITTNVEDANGNSSVTIAGGDNLGYKLWKVPATLPPEGDESTGVLLTTAARGDRFRFIGITGFDIIGVDNSSGVRRRTSMAKGIYKQTFFVGDEIQLDSEATALVTNNQKLAVLTLEVSDMQAQIDALQALVTALPQTGDIVEANIKYVNDIEVKGTGEDNDPWNPV